MKAAKLTINALMLNWAIERSGKRTSLARKFPKLEEWKIGKSQPTLRQLEQFANETSTPLGFLFLEKPPEEVLPIPHYRTLDDNQEFHPSPDLIEVVQTLEQRQTWLREYLIEQGQKPLSFVGVSKINDDPKRVAIAMRSALGLTQKWGSQHSTWTGALGELRQQAEDVGIVVVINGVVGNNAYRKLDTEEFRGFVLIDEYAPFVFINGADSKAAQMFTLAHEIAHVFLGKSAVFDLTELQPAHEKTEEFCNAVAAEFLVPAQELRDLWPEIRKSKDSFNKVARNFKVSSIVAARRLQDMNLITKVEFLEFYREYLTHERKKKKEQEGGGDFYSNQNLRIGKRFAETVIRAAKEGSLLYRDAYKLTELHGTTFDKYVKKLGVGE